MKTRREAKPVFEVVAEKGGFAVYRNGRYLMSPAGAPYVTASRALAEAIAAEWDGQGEIVVPSAMPMTQLAATSLDIVRKDRGRTRSGLLAYVDSELLCQRADRPDALVVRQEEVWRPFLTWCRERTGAVFEVGCGVMPARQKPEVSRVLGEVLDGMDDFRLAGVSVAADSAGSLVLGLALSEGAFTAAEVFKACELDVIHQTAAWGEDPVTKGRQASVRKDLEMCERWFWLLGGKRAFGEEGL